MPRFAAPTRLLIALSIFALVWAWAQAQDWEGSGARFVLWLGQQLGYEYFNLSGRILMTPDGPFVGGPSWMNYAYDVVPELTLALAALIPAAAAFAALSRFHRRPDGHTRCGRCGHILCGLSDPRCPECGRAI